MSGVRRDDLALRLKYAGFDKMEITDITQESLKGMIASEGDVCYMLVNYTVLFETQTLLKGLEG